MVSSKFNIYSFIHNRHGTIFRNSHISYIFVKNIVSVLGRFYYSHLIDEDTKAQSNQLTGDKALIARIVLGCVASQIS